MVIPGRSFQGYRYGLNGQEKVDEVKGFGNHNTALFWEYDTRLGRRWNLDPKPNFSISNYACFVNNPIMFSDLLGDSAKSTKAFENNKTANQALIDIMKTKAGRKYFAKYAAAGDSFGGYTFTKNGKLHDKGVDLLLDVADFEDPDAGGDTPMPTVEDGRLKIKVFITGVKENDTYKHYKTRLLWNDYNGAVRTPLGMGREIYKRTMLRLTEGILHETMIHAEEWSIDWLNDGKLTPVIEIMHHQNARIGIQKYRDQITNKGPWPGAAYDVLDEIRINNNVNINEEGIWRLLRIGL